eukprot:TRINITY_DN53405_c0_g1_i1.p2 TRINITY_DN53405_c0_g1~~TRINITY_DN53405_c0_g1_i1.p2  ORF type:complete len:109 (-),score=12.44 TRINITY_DN53405_c0_g1_i1:127-453(-)
MRKQVVFIVLITIMALISCTGCDSEIGGTIDLSYDVATLTSFQWVKELSNGDTEYLTFNVTPFNEESGLYVLNIFDNDDPHVLCVDTCLLYTSPSPRDLSTSRMPSSA